MIYKIICKSFHTPEGFAGKDRAAWNERMEQCKKFAGSADGVIDLFRDIAAHGSAHTYVATRAEFVSVALTSHGFPAILESLPPRPVTTKPVSEDVSPQTK